MVNLLDDPLTQGILSFGGNMLAASGPSRMPVSIGQAMGQGALGGLGAYNTANEAKRRAEQTAALIALEKAKEQQSLVSSQAQLASINLRREALGLPPINIPMSGQGAPSPALATGSMPALSMVSPSQGQPPNLMQAISKLPPHFQQAAQADIAMNSGQGLAKIIQDANSPVVGREGGIYTRGTNGQLVLDPGWLAGERERLNLQKGVGNENEIVDVPMPDGTTQKMTKADALKLAGNRGGQPANGGVEFNVGGMRGTAPDEQSAMKIAMQLNPNLRPVGSPSMPGFNSGVPTERSVATARDRAAGEESGRRDAMTVDEYRKKLPSMAAAMVSLNKLDELNKDEKTYASAGAEFKKDLGRIAQAFGIKINEKETGNTELYIARMGELLKERLASKDYGSGTGISNLDLATAGVPLPEVAKTPDGRQKIINAIKQDLLRSYADMRGAVDYFEENKALKGFKFPSESVIKDQGIPKTPAPGRPPNNPQNNAAPTIGEERTSKSGKPMKWDGMRWVYK